MHPTRTISAALTALFVISAPVAAENHASADTVVATVNGTDITLAHMIVLKQRLPAQYQQLPPDTLFDGILDQLIQQTLLGQEGPDLSAGAIAALENEERALKAAQVIREVAEVATTDAALQEAYDAAYGNAAPETEYNASHILVATEDEAKALVDELSAGADFATLAQEKSTGPSGPNGGQLGWFGAGMMVAPFEEAVMAMEAGTVSAPVQTQFGWHVIRLNETRQKDAPSLDDVRPQLIEQIQRVAIDQTIASLSEGAEITRLTPLDLDPTLLDDLSLVGE